jgi:hypothetical protein
MIRLESGLLAFGSIEPRTKVTIESGSRGEGLRLSRGAKALYNQGRYDKS